jgi:biotin transport system substrate-specific component
MSTLAPTLSKRYFPHAAAWLRDLALITLSALFVAVLAQVRIFLPFTPVPLTGQTFGVLLVGAALGSKRGLASLSLYTALGLAGLPVFTGWSSGLAHLLGLTGGYLFGFLAAAWLVGRLAERGLERSLRTSLLPFAAGTLVIYLCGTGWLALQLGLAQALALGVLPFLIGDLLKLLAAALLLPGVWKFAK